MTTPDTTLEPTAETQHLISTLDRLTDMLQSALIANVVTYDLLHADALAAGMNGEDLYFHLRTQRDASADGGPLTLWTAGDYRTELSPVTSLGEHVWTGWDWDAARALADDYNNCRDIARDCLLPRVLGAIEDERRATAALLPARVTTTDDYLAAVAAYRAARVSEADYYPHGSETQARLRWAATLNAAATVRDTWAVLPLAVQRELYNDYQAPINHLV